MERYFRSEALFVAFWIRLSEAIIRLCCRGAYRHLYLVSGGVLVAEIKEVNTFRLLLTIVANVFKGDSWRVIAQKNLL